MSDLLRQSVNGMSKLKVNPMSIPEQEEDQQAPSKPFSSSPANSSSSESTLRPNPGEDESSQPTHWSHYFTESLTLTHTTPITTATYHVYLTPPANPTKGPLFICHHGAGVSALSFALLAQQITLHLPHAGVLSLEARAHGSSTVTSTETGAAIPDFSLETLTADAATTIQLTQTHQNWPSLPPSILIGHSLGGAIVASLAASGTLGPSLVGFAVLDVVEGSALEALGHMKSHLASRPTTFSSVDEGVDWHVRSRTLRNRDSARVSVPSILTPLTPPITTHDGEALEDEEVTWKTDLHTTSQSWWSWFTGMSARFLSARGAKLLVLAGTDRLDKDLMIGQMQGKFQLVVVPEAGHFVHEDAPERVAEVVVEFWRRNDGASLVLPMKVDEMIRMGKKV